MARSPTGDNVSMHSAYSVATEDTTLQEAYMGAVSEGREEGGGRWKGEGREGGEGS